MHSISNHFLIRKSEKITNIFNIVFNDFYKVFDDFYNIYENLNQGLNYIFVYFSILKTNIISVLWCCVVLPNSELMWCRDLTQKSINL